MAIYNLGKSRSEHCNFAIVIKLVTSQKKKKKKAVCQELDKESISINILEVVGSWIY